MNLRVLDACLAAVLSFAAIHYAIKWWFSRHERILGVFAIQCGVYASFTWTMFLRHGVSSVEDAQTVLDLSVTLGLLGWIVFLQFYALLADRRDMAFRAITSGVLLVLAIVNQWLPVRGTVLEIQTIALPVGGTTVLPIRSSPGALLAMMYVGVLVIQAYGGYAVYRIWKRGDRAGAALIGLGIATIQCTVVIGLLVDFAGLLAPYLGAMPLAFFTLCMSLFFAREYSARAKRVVIAETQLRAHRDRLEELVAARTQELSEMKDLAERANAAKSKFLAHISHEIRTPLGVIMLYAQLLQRYSTLDEDQRKKVGIILSSGKHLLTLLSDVLEMSKIEAGRMNLVEDRFDLSATLDEIERMFTVQTAAGVTLAIERDADLPRSLYADSGKVKQILINLVSNAIKFTKQGSIRVTASARPRADGQLLVEIVVADTGIGIAPVDVARMFQPFQQLEPGARAGGTGLGLTISRTHARLMRGDLTVESTQNAGSTFTFTFEARSVDSALKLPRITTPVTLPAQAKVLIVDDVQHNRDLLEELLAKASFETRIAADGPRALALHADWSPDLVLMDLRMPDMDGLEAIRQMRAAGSKAAIGVLTASALAADEPDALANGADFFMRKPYDERELFKQIARVLGDRT